MPPVPSLLRRLGPFPATNLVIGDMIGAGIFTTSGLLLGELGSPTLMMALWLAGGILAFCGAHLMRGRSELSRAQREMIAVVASAANHCHY